METLFLDVGFGSSSLILLGSGSAIVIDAGKDSQATLAALHHFGISRIEHLIVSHWHDDHCGGAQGVLQHFSGRIGGVWFPFDSDFKKSSFWHELRRQCASGGIDESKIDALMVNSGGVREIWSSAPLKAKLEIVSPSHMEMMQGVSSAKPNLTCGILVLRVGSRAVVFGGDAELKHWESAYRRVGGTISAEVMSVPHHAGVIWPGALTPAQIDAVLDKLYTTIVKPKLAIISAGTKPGKHHPNEAVIRAITRNGIKVMCTQMTSRCTSDLEHSRELQRTTVPRVAPGKSRDLPILRKGKSNHVACAGSVLVEVTATGSVVAQLAPHDTLVKSIRIAGTRKPMCK